jgi:iron complex outermembrane receptor protein
MHRFRLPSIRSGLAAGVLLCAMALPATGPLAAAEEGDKLEEIVVTAQKRSGTCRRRHLGGGLLRRPAGGARRHSTTEITQQIPSLQMNAWSPVLTVFNLRGVSQNSFTDNLEAPVAVYIDDAYVSSMNAISGQMFDMQRVEVLRGPQGTLFGRNATGGLVHFLTHGADESEANGYVEVRSASYSSKSIEAAFGGALGERLRGRVAGRWEKADGYVKAAIPTARAVGGADGYALRGALQFDASDNLKVDLRTVSKDSDVPTGGYIFLPYADQNAGYIPTEWIDFTQNMIFEGATDPSPYASWRDATADIFFNPVNGFAPSDAAGLTLFRGDSPEPYTHYSDYRGYMNRAIHNGTLKLNWDAGPVDVVSISNFMTMDKFYTEDGDGIPLTIIEFTTINNMRQWSEVRLRTKPIASAGRRAGTTWTSTSMHPRDRRRAGAGPGAGLLDDGTIEIGLLPAVDQIYTLDSRNWSLFGQAEYDFTDALTLIAGLRWSQDDKKLLYHSLYSDSINNVPGFNLQQAIAAAGGGNQDTVDYGDYAARLQLNYHVNKDVLLFTSYNRGIKGGNFNTAANEQLDNVKHKEEVLHSFELGGKSTFFDGRARLNATAFYYDYKDYQVFALVGGQPQVRNSDATIKGGEIEFFLKPGRHWDAALGASFLDSKIDNVPVAGLQYPPAGLPAIDWPEDFVYDTKMPNAPDYSVNYLLRYNWDMLNGNMAVQVDGVYYADQYLEATNGGASWQNLRHQQCAPELHRPRRPFPDRRLGQEPERPDLQDLHPGPRHPRRDGVLRAAAHLRREPVLSLVSVQR